MREDLGSQPLPSSPVPLPQPGAWVWEGKAQGRQGLARGPPPGAVLLTVFSCRLSPAPSQALGQACVCCGDLGRPGPSFILGQLLLAFCCGAGRPAMPDSPGADGPQWESAALALRGLASFFPPFVPLPEAASAQTTKAACLTASGGAGVTADSGALGDSSTPCVLECPEHLEHPGSGKDQKSWLPAEVSGKHASRQGVGAMPRTGSERVCVPSHHLAEDLRPGGVRTKPSHRAS